MRKITKRARPVSASRASPARTAVWFYEQQMREGPALCHGDSW